ncbi:MAG TPA: folylpolyglutamate synthase/dihydrofolate synthase family protein, partial [Candidatus Elarobacter sp.]|nr:folylpolyglutamate synthase/dihydrofolate synthase family protein [Candidatus Elarobacter sp.]
EKTGGRITPGLERTQELLEHLGDPQRAYRSFHVAGTNGKGSTVAMLDHLLRSDERRVGRYTSPHLVDFRERVLVNGDPIPPEAVLRLLERIEPVAERNGATFFEITTALAFAYFAEQGVDLAVIETGLGGRLDSTNVLDPVAATVTNIALDHTEYLGATLQEIADEKSGIFKFGRAAVIGEPRADLARRLVDRAAERGATPISVVRADWRAWSIAVSGTGTSFTAETPRGRLRLTTPLLGEHQVRNTLTALATLSAAGDEFWMARDAINRALANVRLPGRFQRSGEWLFDVAHNPAGAQVLAATLGARPVARPLTVVLGVLKDKDWYGIVEALAPVVDRFIMTVPPSAPADRTWDPRPAAAHANTHKIPTTIDPDFNMAIARARALPGTKLVTGSFHTVGDAMVRLGVDPLAATRTSPPV